MKMRKGGSKLMLTSAFLMIKILSGDKILVY